MPKKTKSKNSNKKNKTSDKNKIDIRININSKKDDKIKKKSNNSYSKSTQKASNRSSTRDVIQHPSPPNFQNPIVHIQPVQPIHNSSLLDNQYGIGMARQLTAIEGDVNRIKLERDEAIGAIQNERLEREKLTNLLTQRMKELRPLVYYEPNITPQPFTTQPKNPLDDNNSYHTSKDKHINTPYEINLEGLSDLSDASTTSEKKKITKHKRRSETERLKEDLIPSHRDPNNSTRRQFEI
jgi:hypothetical protein